MDIKYNIKNYYYNYKIKIENKKITTIAIIERNYIKKIDKNKNQTIDIPNNLFIIKNMFKDYYLFQIKKFKNKIIKEFRNCKFSYNIDINYFYYKSKNNKDIFSLSNYYYELNIQSYNKKNKIGFNKKIKIKKLKFKTIKNEILNYEIILNKKIDSNEGLINTKYIIIQKYALSQIISLYKKELWKTREQISKNNIIKICYKKRNNYNSSFYDKNGNKIKKESKINNTTIMANKSFSFDNKNKIENLEQVLKKGYVITNVYFLNNTKEDKNNIKALCSGYFIKNQKIEFLFSNKILSFNIIKLINNIEFVSKNSFFSNEFICPDILTKLKD